MTDNIIEFTGTTYSKISAETILTSLLENADTIDKILITTVDTEGVYHMYTSENYTSDIVFLAYMLDKLVNKLTEE
tara:strand:+ start:2193 stop:2420 length:228 start_codon:yes stop_codon:yes gene_type:complete